MIHSTFLKTHGDSLWVKDDAAFGGNNTLYNLMESDSNAPATRVYVLLTGGVYSIVNNPTSSTKQQTIVMGESNALLKNNQGDVPPVLQGAVVSSGNTTGGINTGYDLLLKNCEIELGNSAGGEGWGFFGGSAGDRLQVENCIVEHNLSCAE